ncbi:MAG TPA: glycerophosphodiester phosphodiesterase [Candidatus Dormibacteraeota bacterium]|nr:glycerophosphodiester phosphodiesterase [Candidatus Dormibacteraeota bacterium]
MRPLISAHRGSCGIEGDGLPAAEQYRRAIALGVDYVEIDARRTADGIYVTHHDDLTPSGRASRQLTYTQLRDELGTELLTLEEVLDIAVGRTGLHVDLKEGDFAPEIVRLVLDRLSESDFVVTTGAELVIRRIKDQFPMVTAGLTLGRDVERWPPWRILGVRLSELFPGPRLKRSHADFVAMHQQLARIRLLSYTAARTIPAWVWTVDDEIEMARFLADPRVTTLITNRPDVAIRLRADPAISADPPERDTN